MRLRQTQKDRSFPQEFNKLRPNSWCSTLGTDEMLFLDTFSRKAETDTGKPGADEMKHPSRKDRSKPFDRK